MTIKTNICLFGILTSLSRMVGAIETISIPTNPFTKPSLTVEADTDGATCAQFAGDWSGPCEGVDGKRELQLNIDQPDCFTMIVDGTTFRIDGMDTTISNQGSGMNTGTTAISWDSHKTKVIGQTQVQGQWLGKKKTHKFQFKNKFTIEKEGSVLLVNSDYIADTFENESKKTEKGGNLCRLAKKGEASK